MMILERICGKTAYISDDEREYTVPCELLQGCGIGDVLIFDCGAYKTDTAATEKRRKDIIALQDFLWE